MEKREEILKQLGADRAAITQSQPVQRIAPDLKAEGYNTSRGYIEKSTGETFFLRIAPDEEVGLGKRVYCQTPARGKGSVSRYACRLAEVGPTI